MVKDAVIPAIQIYPTKNDDQIFIIADYFEGQWDLAFYNIISYRPMI